MLSITDIEPMGFYTTFSEEVTKLEDAITSELTWEDVGNKIPNEQKDVYKQSVSAVQGWLKKVSPRVLWLIGMHESINQHKRHRKFVDFSHQPRPSLSEVTLETYKLTTTSAVVSEYKQGEIFNTSGALYDVSYNAQRDNGVWSAQRQCKRSAVEYFFACLYHVAEQSGHIKRYLDATVTFDKELRSSYPSLKKEKEAELERLRDLQEELEKDQNVKVVEQFALFLPSFESHVDVMIEQLKEQTYNQTLQMHMRTTWNYLKSSSMMYVRAGQPSNEVDRVCEKLEEALFPDKSPEELKSMGRVLGGFFL